MSDDKSVRDLEQRVHTLTEDVEGIQARAESATHHAAESEHLADIE